MHAKLSQKRSDGVDKQDKQKGTKAHYYVHVNGTETSITLKVLRGMEQLVDTSRYLLDLFTVVLSR